MNENTEVREFLAAERPAIEALYPDMFPDEDLLPLVRDLLDDPQNTLSFVAARHDELVGHVAFTACTISEQAHKLALLGPLGVAPAEQRRGTGSALVQEGLQRLHSDGVTQVLVLGDPNYYGRFGFTAETDIQPPYPLPEQWQSAWQSLELQDAETGLTGTLSVTPPWRKPELWA